MASTIVRADRADESSGACNVDSFAQGLHRLIGDANATLEDVDCLIVAYRRLSGRLALIDLLRRRVGFHTSMQTVVSTQHGFCQALRMADNQIRGKAARLVLLVSANEEGAETEWRSTFSLLLLGTTPATMIGTTLGATAPAEPGSGRPVLKVTSADALAEIGGALLARSGAGRVNAVVRPLARTNLPSPPAFETGRHEVSMHASPYGALHRLLDLPDAVIRESHALFVETDETNNRAAMLAITDSRDHSVHGDAYAVALERVRRVVCDIGGYRPRDIGPSTSFSVDLGADDLFLAEVATRLEDDVGVSLSEKSWSRFSRVGDFALALAHEVPG